MIFDEKARRFKEAHETVDDENQDMIPDGGAVSIRMTMMDSAQRAVARTSKSGPTPDDLNAMHNAHWGK